MLSKILTLLPESNRFERIWKLGQVDFKKRYYNDKFGLLWALLNPILQTSIYCLVFTYFLSREIEGIENFALFLFIAIIVWVAFQENIRRSMRTLFVKSYLIENIQINKVDLYISASAVALLGLLFNLAGFIIISFLLGVTANFIDVIWVPLLFLILFLLSTGLGMILSIVYIYFRDISHIVDLGFKLGFWTSGIFFPVKRVVEFFPPLYYINPLLGINKNMRSIFIYDTDIDVNIMSINLMIGIAFYSIGVFLVKNYSHKAVELK